MNRRPTDIRCRAELSFSRLLIAGILAALAVVAASGHVHADERPRADHSAQGEEDTTSGRDTYAAQCARCHQPDGRGLGSRYPALRDAQSLWVDRTRPIQALLDGRRGPIDVDGARFDRVMPGHGYLANETIAAVLTFLLQDWGPGGTAFTTEEVARARLVLLAGYDSIEALASSPSPLAELARVDQVTSDGPPMTVDEFAEAQRLYYGHCTGCHGVLREGTAGNPLTPDVMRTRGTLYLQTVIHYGASSGMPNWGTGDVLSAREMDLLARFLQHPVPEAPDMDLATIRDGWRQLRVPSRRPAEPPASFDPENLFAVTLHDVGQVMLIEGPTRRIITTIDVGRSPHEITASASGRYLYVICRDGTLGLIDLWLDPPERVATVRVGFEARAAAASAYPGFADRYVLAGAFWPPQLVLLDGLTLEPLRLLSTRSYPRAAANSPPNGATARAVPGAQRYHPEPRATDIMGSRVRPEFIASIKETGQFLRVPFGADAARTETSSPDLHADGQQTAGHESDVTRINTVRELRAGGLALDGRHLLTPADSNAIAVLDTETGAVVAEIPARVFGGSAGTSYDHTRFGPVWVTATMANAELLAVGTDPDRHPTEAWQIVERVPAPSAGTLFLATHPESPHLWLDQPLASEPALSGSLAVFQRNDLSAGSGTVPVASWSGLAGGPRRAVQPVFDRSGREVWTLVWNPQNEPSAIVIIDDRTRTHRTTISDPRLITPTRIYRVGDLVNRTRGPLPSGAALYQTHCSNCHGPYGGGDGPLAGSLGNAPLDLRDLSARNDGVFPRAFVTEIIDGRASRAAHGPADMPVWGAELASGSPVDPTTEPTVAQAIDALTEFLASIQRPPD